MALTPPVVLALAFIQWCEVRRNGAISEEAPAGGGLISWHDAAPAAHRRLAVVLGLWIAFQSVTGLVLLFRDPIEHWAHPGLTRHGHGDRGAAAALEAVRRRYPDKVVGPLATPAVSDGVYVIEVGDREVYVDPARARINGSRDHEAGFTALVERLHRRFLFDSVAGLSGARLVALLGLGWLVVSLTGLTTARRTPRTLHRTIGFVVVVPMVLVVVTGVRLAVPDGSDRIWAALTGGGHGRSDAPPQGVTVTSGDRGGDPLDATRILAALDRKYPDGLVARLLMPPPGDRTAPVIAGVSLGLDPGRGQHDYGGNTVVFLDQFSGDTLWEGRPDRVPAARQAALLWSRPLHTGAFAGSVGQLVWGWMAVAVVALGLSGWATRRVRTLDARQEEQRWRRQLKRRRVLARQQRRRAARSGRDRRQSSRRLGRRRKVQARLGVVAIGMDRTDPAVAIVPPEPAVEIVPPEPAPEIDLTDAAVEIDLTDAAVEIDLREPVRYESEITLESGETLESGIVGPPPPD